jgi:hypothetical protein
MLEIVFMGLVLFAQHEAGGGRTVVIPSLPDGVTVTTVCTPTHVEGHMAYLSAAAADVQSCDGCETAGDHKRLRLDGDVVTFSGLADTPYEEEPSFAELIPSLEAICPEFRLAIPDPGSATTLILTKGKLRAQKVKGGERYSTLAVGTNGDITITATGSGGVRRLVLKPGTTSLTIANQGLSAMSGRAALAENHFLAFYKLSTNEVRCSLPVDDDQVQTTIACSNSQYP